MADDLWRLSAVAAVDLLRRKEVKPAELIDAAAARIAAVDGKLNALPTLCLERAHAHAKRLEHNGHPAEPGPGYLHGLPLAIKDLVEVEGVRTTHGSPVYKHHVSARSDYLVERLEANGGIVIAKSNTPEFGAGANTFNEVFGATHNPWDSRLTCGGSSGGAAVALATGQVWLAQGSDLGGSLRIPGSFCSIVGYRPSPGRVAHGPGQLPFSGLSVDGPMARSVADVALMLDAMAGEPPEDPLSLPAPERSFLAATAMVQPPRRVAFSADLGIAPVVPEVAEICRQAAQSFASLGARVEEAHPDLSDAPELFQVLRAAQFAATRGGLLPEHRDKLKEEVIWNIEEGFALDRASIARAEVRRGELYRRAARFFRDYDLLLCPCVMLPPFPVGVRWVPEVEGRTFTTYVDWLMLTYAITLTALPAVSVPCGFTKAGLPVGLQMVGAPRGDARLLGHAALFERLNKFAAMVPMDPVIRH